MSDESVGVWEKVPCPFCNSIETEMIALFGQQMMTSQYYCRHCRSVFEAVKWDDNPQSPITNDPKDQ
jgi:hypothetical protein